MMLVESLQTLFNRDLNKLKTEILLYQDEKKIWHIEKSIANSAGNLCLHLIGNLNTYLGAVIGKTNYIRNRELEFLQKDIPRSELISKIEATIIVVNDALNKLTDETIKEAFLFTSRLPINVSTPKILAAFNVIEVIACSCVKP